MARAAYRDPEHRAAVAALARYPQPCWRCGAPATDVDHTPPLGLHPHRRGAGCCTSRPACARCNRGAGAAIAAARRARRATRASRPW